MAKDLAIVLNNGSLNSAVVTALAAQKFRVILLYAETSASPASRRKAAYDQQVAFFKPYREHSIGLSFLSVLQSSGGAAAVSADPRQFGVLASQLTDLLPVVAAAGRFAAHYQAAGLYLGLRVGSNADELAQATEYVQILSELLQLPCAQGDLELQAPLLELEPWQVIDVGYQVAAPFERSWSCLEETPDPCGSCRGCRAREQAFLQSAKPDPSRLVRR